MKNLILIIAFSIGIICTAQSQAYKTAVGLRLAPSYGVTVKHFVSPTAALEGIFSPRWQGATITGLYEYHTTAFKVSRMNWYFGIGGHVGFGDHHYSHSHSYYKKGKIIWYDNDHDNHSHIIAGVDMILGLEYTFDKLPLNLSLDWKPMLNFIGHQGIWYGDAGLSMRFVF